MSLWQDEKYVRLVSSQLDRFTQKSTHHFLFRCPLCGDSEKNQYKARGYIYPKGDDLMFKCHNCSICLPFTALLKKLSRPLYDEYLMERFREAGHQALPIHSPSFVATFARPTSPTVRQAVAIDVTTALYVLPLTALSEPSSALHEVYRYAVDVRQLPEPALARLFATNRARSWLQPLVGDEKVEKVKDDVPYLVQPFRLPGGTWYGAQLRALDKKDYLTFRWSHEPLKMFGLDAWNPTALTYVVEGPIDALFVPNAITPCGSDLLTGVRAMGDLMPAPTALVYVWDNEPRNKEVVRHIRQAIKLGESVVIWPKGFIHKDINDAIRAGIDIVSLLSKRTFKGLSADLEFSIWTGHR
jgi:hypothetical protein